MALGSEAPTSTVEATTLVCWGPWSPWVAEAETQHRPVAEEEP